jgi:hypothetical protein
LLVDDHNLVRAGMRALLDGLPGFVVIGEAESGNAALDILRGDTPDVVITDISMKGMSGLELCAQLRDEFAAVRVIVLSMFADEDYVQSALRAGAVAYLIKDAATSELEIALHAVTRGETYLSPSVSSIVVHGYMTGGKSELDQLTPRQREIVILLAQGLSAKEIAYQLNISGKTVESHRAQLMDRLNIRDIAGLVKFAIRNSLIDLK